MSDTIFGSSVWAFVVIGGFIILGGAIAFAALRNRQTRRGEAHTEAATRQNYQDEERTRRRDNEV